MKEEGRGVSTLLESYPHPPHFWFHIGTVWLTLTFISIMYDPVLLWAAQMKGALQIQNDGIWVGIWARKYHNVSLLLFKSREFLTERWGFTQSQCGLVSFLAGPWLPRKLLQERLGPWVRGWLVKLKAEYHIEDRLLVTRAKANDGY